MPFKVIPTDEVIQKESNEIENMGKSHIVCYMMLNAKIFACFPICKSLLYAVCALPFFFNQNKDQIIKLLQQQLCLQVLRSISVWCLWIMRLASHLVNLCLHLLLCLLDLQSAEIQPINHPPPKSVQQKNQIKSQKTVSRYIATHKCLLSADIQNASESLLCLHV